MFSAKLIDKNISNSKDCKKANNFQYFSITYIKTSYHFTMCSYSIHFKPKPLAYLLQEDSRSLIYYLR